MTSNDDSVNMERRRRRYHHGDLRPALIAAGLDLLARHPADALSLREVARCVDVSATAVYRHFPDKQALLDALCEEGARMLAHVQNDAMTAAGGGRSGFESTGRAYVRFALAHPALFRLMMKTQPSDAAAAPEQTTVNAAMQALQTNVTAILPAGATPEQRQLMAMRAWAMVHGIATLMLDGRLPPDDDLIVALVRVPVV